MFNVGTKVSWKSQAAGSQTKKTGEIVAVVKPGEWYSKARDRIPAKVVQNCSSAHGGGLPRKEVSYIVKVPGKTTASKPTLYWPRTSALAPIK